MIDELLALRPRGKHLARNILQRLSKDGGGEAPCGHGRGQCSRVHAPRFRWKSKFFCSRGTFSIALTWWPFLHKNTAAVPLQLAVMFNSRLLEVEFRWLELFSELLYLYPCQLCHLFLLAKRGSRAKLWDLYHEFENLLKNVGFQIARVFASVGKPALQKNPAKSRVICNCWHANCY